MAYGSSGEAKKAGWFSRRHQDNEAHMDERSGRMNRETQRQIDAQRRADERDMRSDTEQLHLLIERGHGHCKEALRLKERVRAGFVQQSIVDSEDF